MKEFILSQNQKIKGFIENSKNLKLVFSIFSPLIFSLFISSVKLPLATYPFGFSLISAAKRDTFYFYLGGIIFAVFTKNIPLFLGYTSIIIFRFIFSRLSENRFEFSFKKEDFFSAENLFSEGESLKMAVATLGAFTYGMLKTVFGGFTIGDLVGTVFCIVISPAVCYLFSGFFSDKKKKARYETGYMALLCAFVLALSGISFFGMSLSVFFTSFISFLIAKSRSPMVASLFSLICIIAAEPLLSPAFAVAVFIAATLEKRSKIYSVCASAISFASLSYFVSGLPLFAASFPEYLAGAVIAIPVKKEFCDAFLPFFGYEQSRKIDADRDILTYKERKGRENIAEISKSFEELSKTFFELSDKNKRISIFDTRQICDRVCDRYCRRCAARDLCWERDYPVTLDTVNKISAKIYKSGRVTTDDLPKEFTARCHNAERLVSDIEKENTKVIKSLIKEDKTRAFALDYSVFSKILSEALEKNEAEYAPNAKARDSVKEELSKIGFSADSIGVYGTRCKKVYAFRISKSSLKCSAADIKNAVSTALSGRCEDPTFEFTDGGINVTVKNCNMFKTSVSLFGVASKKGEENGDCVRFFDGKNGFSYMLLCDGMGSGSLAAKKSLAASVFLEKMLSAGNSVSSSLSMLSALERADSNEGFTTLDLFEIDLVSGGCSFVKSGAAPSFVKRGTKLFKIRSKTFPIGILEDVDAERTTFGCMDGDKIIMLSDGVTEESEEPLWLCEFLTETDLETEDAAEKIVREAKKHTLGRDDMSAAVITISKISD